MTTPGRTGVPRRAIGAPKALPPPRRRPPGGTVRPRDPLSHRRRPSPAVIRRRRMTVGTAFLVVLVAALVGLYAAVTAGSTPAAHRHTSTSATVPRPKPIRVSAVHQVTFTETCSGCSTENYVSGVSTPGRTLVTDVWFPTRDGVVPATANGTAPLVLLAHGFDLDPTDYMPLVDAWVLAGYAVAAPVFPVTNAAAMAPVLRAYPDPATGDPHGNPEDDTVHEPSDLAFVLQQLIAADTQPSAGAAHAGGGLLAGLFDPSKVAVAGESDGGDVVAALGYNSCCSAGPAATHVQAIAVLSGAENSSWFSGSWFATPGPPLLVAQGTNDACNPPPSSVSLYNAAPVDGGKVFVTLLGADHLAGYTAANPWSAATASVTTAFFDLALHHGHATTASVLAAGTTSVTQATAAASAPALKAVPVNWSFNPGTSADPCSITFTGPPGTTTTTVGP